MIEEMLAYNKKFVEEKRYEQYDASKYPNKKVAILTCMYTRLVELLPAALGIKNGDGPGHRSHRLWRAAHRQRNDDPPYEESRHFAGIDRPDEILWHRF